MIAGDYTYAGDVAVGQQAPSIRQVFNHQHSDECRTGESPLFCSLVDLVQGLLVEADDDRLFAPLRWLCGLLRYGSLLPFLSAGDELQWIRLDRCGRMLPRLHCDCHALFL